MHLILGFVEFLAGGWFFGWLRQKQYIQQVKKLEDERLRLTTWKQGLDLCRAAMLKQPAVEDVLSHLTAMDAIRRENRAKAALEAVLKADGCSQEMIERVLGSVDNVEDGDVRRAPGI